MKSPRSTIYIIAIISILTLSLSGCKTTSPTVEVTDTVDESSTIEEPLPTNTPRPTLRQPTAVPEPTQVPDTPTLTPEQEPTVTSTLSSQEEPEETSTPEIPPTPTVQASPTKTAQTFPSSPRIVATNALKIVPNPDPGPPITVQISANHLLEGHTYRLSGTIRNDSDENYTGLSVIATFFLESGNRYGPIHESVKCLFLAPGATCPFVIKATTKFVTGVILHTTGRPTPRTPLAPEYWGVGYRIDSIGYVHITGTVHNQYTIPARHVTVVGSLVNAQGEIVNVNSTILLDAIPPGGTAPFEINVKYVPFRSVNITTNGEP
jgi:hypothetical protein